MKNDLISRKALRKTLEAELKECRSDGGEAELIAIGFEDAIDFVNEAASVLDYHGKKFNQDEEAHKVYAFAMDTRNMQSGSVVEICNYCRGHLKTYYCEEGLYLVRCLKCGVAALVQARTPSEAACKTIGGLNENQ